jgi:uncharacterized coiled-coil DUF342 family protein
MKNQKEIQRLKEQVNNIYVQFEMFQRDIEHKIEQVQNIFQMTLLVKENDELKKQFDKSPDQVTKSK